MADGKVVYQVRADDSKITTDLKNADKKVRQSAEKSKAFIKKTSLAVGAGLAAIAAASTKLGINFEQGIADASTLFGDTKVSVDNLKESMLDVSDATGVAADELTKGLYSALSAGIPVTEDMGEATEFLEKSAKLAKAGFTDMETALSATAKTLNAYGLETSEANRIQGILLQTQNKGITTVDELGGLLANVTPTAAAAGVSFEEVGAALATMTAQGTKTGAATTQLNAAITAFLRPNEQMLSGLENIAKRLIEEGKLTGKNVDTYKKYQKVIAENNKKISQLDKSSASYKDNLKALQDEQAEASSALQEMTADFGIQILQSQGLQESLTLLNEEFDGSSNMMAKALGSSEALKTSLAITGENAEKFTSNLEAMSDTTGVVDEGFNKVTQTTQERLNKSFNEFKNTLIKLFDAIQPIILALLDFANGLAAGETPAKLIAIAIGGITAALVAYNVAAAIAAAETTVLATAVAFLTAPITLVILAIAALIAAAVLIVDNWEWISEQLTILWENIKTFFMDTWNAVSEFFIEWSEIFYEMFLAAWQAITDYFKTMTDFQVNTFKKTWNAIMIFFTEFWKTFSEFFMKSWQALGTFFTNIWETIVNQFEGSFNTIKEFFMGIIDFIVNVFSGQWENAWSGIIDTFGNLFSNLGDLVKFPFNKIIDGMNWVINGLNSISVDIPSWVPGVGGKSFGVSISSIPHLAKGGLAFGDTMAMVGDNADSAVNPEVVAPVNVLQDYIVKAINDTGSKNISLNVNSDVQIDGETIARITLQGQDDALSYM